MRKTFIFLFLLFVYVGESPAQTTPETEQHHAQLAKQFLDVVAQAKYLRNTLALAFDGLPIVGEAGFFEDVEKEIDKEKLEREFIRTLIRRYNSEELSSLIEFYSSPTGQSILRKRPQFLKDINAILYAELVQAIQSVLEQRKAP